MKAVCLKTYVYYVAIVLFCCGLSSVEIILIIQGYFTDTDESTPTHRFNMDLTWAALPLLHTRLSRDHKFSLGAPV